MNKCIIIDNESCMKCGGCVSVCPADALILDKDGIQINDKCICCLKCITFCPVSAIKRV